MAAVVGSLLIELLADNKQLSQALTAAGTDLTQLEAKTTRSLTRMDRDYDSKFGNMAKSVSLLKGGIAGLVTGATVGTLTAITRRLAETARSVAEIGDNAKFAGLTAKAFQELSHVASQNRIPLDAMADAMKELSLRADEFIVTGKGSAAEAFQRLGFGADDLKRRLQDPSALLVEITSRLQKFDAAARIRIADELFGGTGGERLVQLFDRGADSLRRTVKEANDLGLVLDDKVIARADELDRRFNAIGVTASTWTKKSIIGLADAMAKLMDSFNKAEEASDRAVETRLVSLYDKLAAERQHLADLQQVSIGSPADALNIKQSLAEIDRLTAEAMKLRDILDRRNGYKEDFIYQTGESAKDAKPPVDSLNDALDGSGNSASDGAKGIKSYAEAIRALKDEIPELANGLAKLDAQTRIDQVYRAALSKAQTMGQVYQANELRGSALKSVSIKSATDDPSRYLSNVLASGKSLDHINGLADTFSEKLARMIASMPDDLKGAVTINSGFRSIERQQQLWLDALKKYGSPEAARKWVAPPGNSQHNAGNAADLGYKSDAAKNWVHQNAGTFGLSFPMSHEPWHVEDAEARKQANTTEIQRQTDAFMDQANAYREIVSGSKAFTAEQGVERQALAMTGVQAAAYRYEQEMLAQAQQSGITLTQAQRTEISQLAQGMAEAEQATNSYAETQQAAAELSRFFGQQAVSALGGLITGTMSAKDALNQLLNSLIQAVLQASLLGQGPLASLFGGGGGLFGGGGGNGGAFATLCKE